MEKEEFEKALNSLMIDMVDICNEYSCWKADKIFIYAMYEDLLNCQFFLQIDGEILSAGNADKANKEIDTSADCQRQVLNILKNDFEKIVELFQKENKEVPTEMRIVYNSKEKIMNTKFKYGKQFTKGMGLTDIYTSWIEEEKSKMKKHLLAKLFPFFSLLAASLLAFASFQLEMRCFGLNQWWTGVLEVRYCFAVIPALFSLWLFAFFPVFRNARRICLFLISYVLWFLASWYLLPSLVAEEGIFFLPKPILPLILNVIDVFEKRGYYAIIALDALCIYSIFILENLAVKKIFGFVFKKIDWAFLFAYPLVVAFFSLSLWAAFELASGWNYYSLSYLFQPIHHFYRGTVIFGYMMCEGLIFIRQGRENSQNSV